MRITSAEGKPVGVVRSVLWKDDTGNHVIGVAGRGREFVMPVKPRLVRSEIRTRYSSETIRTGLTVEQFKRVVRSKGTDAAAEVLGDHYEVNLSGPPPGPPTTPVPPWWKRLLEQTRARDED
jgi:hypothetical protein